ncbi:MAG: hypothetical protein KC636_37140 [Myxococcales bacterium]|nr:hypothetical protein [Myxococcales bacterium]
MRSPAAVLLWVVPLALTLACGDRAIDSESTDSDATASTGDSADTSGSDTTAGPGTSDSSDGSDSEATSDATTTDPTTGEPSEYDVFELRAPDFSPPKLDTWYSCMSWTFPVEDAVHIVGFKPQVDDPHVHHYVLGIYPEPQNVNPADPCFAWVDNMIWGWAPGGEELWLPDDVGIRAGDSGTVTFVMQVHYNNPLGQDFVDDGGADIFYTSQLRTHEAGIVRLGDIPNIVIPPGEPNYEHVATCPSWATQAGLKGDLNVIGTWLHAHDIGKTLWTEVFRDGQLVGELGREDPFKFDYQTFREANMVVKPGDEFVTHCVYDSTGRDQVTYGGDSTDEEMCINFLLYYPHDPALVGCGAL